jgi:prephenate dehydratase
MSRPQDKRRIGYLGPKGTFSEEALLTQSDLRSHELVPFASFLEIFDSLASHTIDQGFVAIENSIEGTVAPNIDSLIFSHNFLIQREVVLPIHQQLLGLQTASLSELTKIYSYPHASGQCRRFLAEMLEEVEVVATNSTAQAAEMVAQSGDPSLAAIAPLINVELHSLKLLAHNIEDFANNQTRFVLLACDTVPTPSGNDKTSIVCFQLADRPGSLHGIVEAFARRSVNLTKLESRPTKRVIGEYCFVIDFEGHIHDPVISECLEELTSGENTIKFLGSYPASERLSTES